MPVYEHQTPRALQAVLLHDPLITDDRRDTTHGSYAATQRGPLPGVAVYQTGDIGVSSATAGNLGPTLRVLAMGQQDDNAVAVMVDRAGMPGDGCEVVTRVYDADAGADVWRAGSTPTVLDRMGAPALDRGGDGPRNVDGVRLADGSALVVWHNSGIIYCRTYDPTTGDWAAAAVTVADHTRAMDADGAMPTAAGIVDDSPVCVERLPSGRLLVAVLVEGPDAAADADLAMHYSDDDGATWIASTLQGYDTPVPSGADYDCIEMAHSGDSVLMLISAVWTDGEQAVHRGWLQYASDDIGGSFRLVQTWNDGNSTDEVGRPTIVVDNAGRYHVLHHLYTSSYVTSTPQVRSISSPWEPLREVTATQISAGISVSTTDCVGWAESTGLLWAAWEDGEQIRLARSVDLGQTWTQLDTALTTTPGLSWSRLLAVPCGGGVLWLVAGTGLTRPIQNMSLLQSGGWTMLPQPRVGAGHPGELRGWDQTWHAVCLPTVHGWTLTGTAGTVAISGDYAMTITAGTGYYSLGLGSISPEVGLSAEIECKTTTTSSGFPATHVGASLVCSNGSQDIRIDVRLENAAVQLWDLNAGAAVAASAAWDMTERTALRVSIRYRNGTDPEAALYAREYGSDYWQLLAVGPVVRRTSGAAAASSVAWGNLGTVGSSTWYRVGVSTPAGSGSHTATTDSLAAGVALSQAPYTLPGAWLPSAPGRLWVTGQTYLQGREGPGRRGDRWEIAPRYRAGLPAVLSRSPQEPYSSTGAGLAQVVLYEPEPGHLHHPGGTAVGIGVVGANVRTIDLVGESGAGLVQICQLDLAAGTTSLGYTRSGDTLRVSGAGIASYLRARDLVGSTVDLGSSKLRTVRRATSGVWRAGSIGVSLQLDGVDGTEPTSGTLDLWRTQGAAVRLGMLTGYQWWGWRIPVQSTVSGRFRVGRVVIGPAVLWGHDPSRGRSVLYETARDVVESPGAVAGRTLAPMRRVIDLGWREGVPQSWGDDPGYLQAGGVPAAMRGDLSPIESLTADHGALDGQLVYLPRLDYDRDAVAEETVSAVGREVCVYAEISRDPTVEDISGRLARDPVQRATMQIREVV